MTANLDGDCVRHISEKDITYDHLSHAQTTQFVVKVIILCRNTDKTPKIVCHTSHIM